MICVDGHQLAVVAAHDDAFAVRGRTQNAAAVNGHRFCVAIAIRERDVFFRADERRDIAEKMHGCRGRIERHPDHGAIARDVRRAVEAERNAKAEALRLAAREQEPLRLQVARAGSTLKARLGEALGESR